MIFEVSFLLLGTLLLSESLVLTYVLRGVFHATSPRFEKRDLHNREPSGSAETIRSDPVDVANQSLWIR